MPPSDRPEQEGTARAPLKTGARLKMGIGVAVTVGLVVLSAAVGWGILRGQAAPVDSIPLEGPAAVDDGAGVEMVTGGTGLYVHVLGAVTHPGLYILESDARLVDALAAAGGTLETADLQAVNLARPLSDGEQIIVPEVGAEPLAGGSDSGPGADGLIDLNNADQAALETLPRIGPALAQRILDWRGENGRFRSVDDLLAVPGIGDKLLAGLREKVRV